MLAQRLKGMRAYLAGPMDRISGNGVEWRQKATKFLHRFGIGVFDPCDKPTKVGGEVGDQREKREECKKKIANADKQNLGITKLYKSIYRNIMKDIVSVDLRMIDLSDFILMHVDMDVHTCGTYNEQAHACLQRKPLIVWATCDSPNELPYHIPDWLYGHAQPELFFNSLDAALAYIQSVHFEPNEDVIDTYGRWKFFDYDKVYGKKDNEI